MSSDGASASSEGLGIAPQNRELYRKARALEQQHQELKALQRELRSKSRSVSPPRRGQVEPGPTEVWPLSVGRRSGSPRRASSPTRCERWDPLGTRRASSPTRASPVSAQDKTHEPRNSRPLTLEERKACFQATRASPARRWDPTATFNPLFERRAQPELAAPPPQKQAPAKAKPQTIREITGTDWKDSRAERAWRMSEPATKFTFQPAARGPKGPAGCWAAKSAPRSRRGSGELGFGAEQAAAFEERGLAPNWRREAAVAKAVAAEKSWQQAQAVRASAGRAKEAMAAAKEKRRVYARYGEATPAHMCVNSGLRRY